MGDGSWGVQDAWETRGARRQRQIRRGMVLPFQPVTLTFTDVHYYVDLPRVRNKFPSLFSIIRAGSTVCATT